MRTSNGTHTLAFVKRLAKKLKKEQQLAHHTALDLAAKSLGYSNWKHFLNKGSKPEMAAQITKKLPTPLTVTFSMFPRAKVVRPNVRMPIEAHKKVALLLDEVLAGSHARKSVFKPIDSVRCELDDWIQNEYRSREVLPDEEFHQMYYGHKHKARLQKKISTEEAAKFIENLETTKAILTEHYHDCTPLRQILRLLDRGISAIEKWASGVTPMKRLQLGDVVHVKPFNKDAVVVEHDPHRDTVRLYNDAGPGLVARHEVSIRRKPAKTIQPMRLFLPYGKYICADGSEVLYNRDYTPMWAKFKDGRVVALEPDTWVTHTDQVAFYTPESPPWEDKKTAAKCLEILAEWGVSDKTPKTLFPFFEMLKTGKTFSRPDTFNYQFPKG